MKPAGRGSSGSGTGLHSPSANLGPQAPALLPLSKGGLGSGPSMQTALTQGPRLSKYGFLNSQARIPSLLPLV